MGCEMGKIKVVMNKPVYLGQAILDLSKIVMYEFHYDYKAPKYWKKLDLCYMDTDSLIYNIEMEDFYKDIAKDVLARFDTSGYNPGLIVFCARCASCALDVSMHNICARFKWVVKREKLKSL